MTTIDTFQGEKKVTGLNGEGVGGYKVITGTGMNRRTWSVSHDKYQRIKNEFNGSE